MSLAAFCVIDRLLAMKNQQLRLMIISVTHMFSIQKITFGSNFLMQNIESPFIFKKPPKLAEAKYAHLKIIIWYVYFFRNIFTCNLTDYWVNCILKKFPKYNNICMLHAS